MERKRKAQNKSKLSKSVASTSAKKKIENKNVAGTENEVEDKPVPVTPKESTPSAPSTPTGAGAPQMQSTPIEGDAKSNISSDCSTDDDFFCFTQHPLVVDWGPEDSPKTKRKKEKKMKKKASKPKKVVEFSPVLPTRCRRFVFKEENGFSNLVEDLKAITELIQKNKENKKSSNAGNSSNTPDTVIKEDISPKTVVKEVLTNDKCGIGAENNGVPKQGNGSFTALLDDDADVCMLQFSQEIEQKLLESAPPSSSKFERNEEPSCSKTSNCVAMKKSSPNAKQDRIEEINKVHDEVVNSLPSSNEGVTLGIPLDRDEWSITDTQALRRNCNLKFAARSVPVEANKPRRSSNDILTQLLDDDADDCIVQCSQEIEEKLKEEKTDLCKPVNKIACTIDKNLKGHSVNTNKDTNSKIAATKDTKSKISALFNSKICSSAAAISNNPLTKLLTSEGRTKSDSALSTSLVSGFGFDDSFDIVMQNFTDDEIIRLSQEVPNKKSAPVHLNSGSLKRGPILKSPANRKMTFRSKDDHQIPKYNNHKSTIPGIVKIPTSALNTNRVEFKMKVPSMGFGNNGALKSNNSRPTVTKSLQEKKAVTTSKCCSLAPAAGESSCSVSKYSPEDIEKKRLEAKKKLEMKKLNSIRVKR